MCKTVNRLRIFFAGSQPTGSDAEKLSGDRGFDNGVVAAKAAGMQCVAITTTFPRESLHQADRVITSMGELINDLAVFAGDDSSREKEMSQSW